MNGKIIEKITPLVFTIILFCFMPHLNAYEHEYEVINMFNKYYTLFKH